MEAISRSRVGEEASRSLARTRVRHAQDGGFYEDEKNINGHPSNRFTQRDCRRRLAEERMAGGPTVKGAMISIPR
jgi:hypothetical protein